MRPLTSIFRYLITGMVTLIAVASGATAVWQGNVPGGPDPATLTILVAITLIAAVAAVLTYRQATVVTMLAETGRNLTVEDGKDRFQDTADDLGRLTESLHHLGRRLDARIIAIGLAFPCPAISGAEP